MNLSEMVRPDEADEVRTESGYASQPYFSHDQHEHVFDVDLHSPLDHPMSRHASYQGDLNTSGFGDPDVTAGAGHGLSTEQYPDGIMGFEGDLSNMGLSAMTLRSQHSALHHGSSLMPTAMLHHDSGMMDASDFLLPGPGQQGWNQQPNRHRASSAPQLKPGIDYSLTKNNQYQCLVCHKIKKRECDLR